MLSGMLGCFNVAFNNVQKFVFVMEEFKLSGLVRNSRIVVFQYALSGANTLTSAGCQMWVVFGGRAYKIISICSHSVLSINDMCDLCPSTSKSTVFFYLICFYPIMKIVGGVFKEYISFHPTSLRSA